MSFEWLGLGALGLYLVGLFAVARIARRARRDETAADHFLAARDLGVFVLFLTLYATAYSGNSLLGYPGEAYRRGFSFIMATGFMMSIIVCFHALVPVLRPVASANGFVTPGDWIRHRFGREPGGRALLLGVAVLMTIALANFLLAQLTAMGHVSSQVTGGLVPFWLGVVGLAAVILYYETLGGMRAVAWTDAAQAILMLLGLAALLWWLLTSAGGMEAVTREIAAVRPDAVRVPDRTEQANWISTIVLLGLASVVYPQAIQRIYAARSGRALSRSLALMSFMPLATTLVVTLIGLAAIGHFGNLEGVEADMVMPRLLGSWAEAGPVSTIFAVVVFIGALAAIMSTADSVLLSLGSMLSEDLLDRPRSADSTAATGKWLAAVVLLGMVALALGPRFTLWHLIELKMELLIQCVPAFLLAARWSGLRARPAFFGLVAGTAIAIGGVWLGFERVGGIHMGVLSLLVNLCIAVAGSLAVRRGLESQQASS
ncbi:MAG: sodium:solute symporter family protein [Myxococcales bacterium]|nr:sodium:solute symporter family protein [Myxococcales bacterium]